MTDLRPSARILASIEAELGPGKTVLRPLPQPHLRHVGPFIMLDHFGPIQLTPGKVMDVPEHPHAGFQTVTYLFSGRGKHSDSYGGEKMIYPGGVNWMTAGKGIVHQEELGAEDPDEEGEVEGFQIWVNLPAKYKYVEAGFAAFSEEELPLVDIEGGTLRVIAGSYDSEISPVHTFSPLFLYHIDIDSEAEIILPVSPDHEIGIYVAEGAVMVGEQVLGTNGLAVYPTQEGDVQIYATDPSRLIVMGGQPLNERFASYGPFVMNTVDEIREVMDAYQRGEFGSL